jgi:hypothetical protein
VAEDSIPRFEFLAAIAAAGALSAALAGCASLPSGVGRIARPAGEVPDLVAQAERLQRLLEETPDFTPERRAAEPALTALAMRIAAQMSTPAADITEPLGSPPLDPVSLTGLSVAPAALAFAGAGAEADETPWAVEFGQFEDVELARALWIEITSAVPDASRGLAARTARSREGVSLRAGPLEDRNAAIGLCKTFEAAGVGCTPSRFTGLPVPASIGR